MHELLKHIRNIVHLIKHLMFVLALIFIPGAYWIQ